MTARSRPLFDITLLKAEALLVVLSIKEAISSCFTDSTNPCNVLIFLLTTSTLSASRILKSNPLCLAIEFRLFFKVSKLSPTYFPSFCSKEPRESETAFSCFKSDEVLPVTKRLLLMASLALDTDFPILLK